MLLPLGTVALAQTVSQEDAASKAMHFIRQGQRVMGADSDQLSMAYKAQRGDETYYYVFNYGNQNGYVIVGGDEAAREILGYSENGSFDYNALPPQMQWWLEQYEGQISHAIRLVKAGEMTLDKAQDGASQTKASKSNISPLLCEIEWNQSAPYNSQIPNLSGFTDINAFVTGCVATAAAQIMKYHEWPDQGEGYYEYNLNYTGHGTLTFQADFANTTYDWANMLNTYSGSYSDVEAQAVGTLMYHVGVAAHMSYSNSASGGSSSNTNKVGLGLAKYLRYNKAMTPLSRDYFTDDDWESIVYNELYNNRPVLYGGCGTPEGGSGHEFVCDGYEDGRYHINWGWGGSHNGYFLLTPTVSEKALTPDGTGIGGGASGTSYVYKQDILIGIEPDRTGTSKYTKIVTSDSYTLSASNVAIGQSCNVDGLMYNKGLATDIFSFAARLVNIADDTDEVVAISSTTHELDQNQGCSPFSFILPAGATVGATYKVYPMYMDENGDWQDVMLKPDFTAPELTVAAPDNLILSEPLTFSNEGYLSSKHWTVSFSLKNMTSAPITKGMKVWIFDPATGSSVAYYNIPSNTFEVGEQKDYSYSFNDLSYGKENLSTNKDYWIQILDNSFDDLSDLLTFHFVGDQPVPYTLTSAEWGTLCLPYEAMIPAGLTAYTVSGLTGDALVKTEAEKLEMNKPYLITGIPGSYNFEGPATPAKEGLTNGLLVGNTTSAQTYAPKDSYVLQNIPAQSGLAFYKVENSGVQKVRQYGAYLDGASLGSLASALTFTDQESGITQIAADAETDESAAYSLQGQRLQGQAKGLVIKNGKLNFFK